MSDPSQQKIIGTWEALGWLWRYAGPSRNGMMRGFVFKIVESFIAAVPIVVLIAALRELEDGGRPDNRQILIWVGIMLASLVARYAASYFANLGSWLSSYQVMGEIRLRLLGHIRQLPMGYLTNNRLGDITETTTQDIKMVELLPTMAIPSLIGAVVLPLAVTVSAFFIEWRLALAMLVSLPLAIYAYSVIQRRMQQLAIVRQTAQGDATSNIVEYVQGISVIRAYGQTGSGMAKFDESMENFRKVDQTLVNRISGLNVLFSTIIEAGVALMLLLGSYLLFDGEITPITLMIFLIVSLRAYAPLHELATFGEMSRIAEASLTRVDALLNEETLPEPERDAPLTDFQIRFDDVSFAYINDEAEHVPVLRNVSFVAEPGTITALVGPSGSGKTTITSLIARFWDVDEGSVRIGDRDVRDVKTGTLYDSISMVFQDVYLFNDTIRANIAYGRPDASNEEIETAARKARCHDFIVALPSGYDTLVGEGGATLSGGERQRVSIARAILKDTPIILLDEATASVDPINERLIQEAIDSLVENKTLIIIAHRLTTIENADQVLVLSEGRIIERGVHADLVEAGGLYARFWRERAREQSWSITAAGAESPVN